MKIDRRTLLRGMAATLAVLPWAGGDVAAALAKWEPAQLELSNSLMRRAIDVGERFQVTNTSTPGDPSLRFGLYGPGH